jgi:hypothetical protein
MRFGVSRVGSLLWTAMLALAQVLAAAAASDKQAYHRGAY